MLRAYRLSSRFTPGMFAASLALALLAGPLVAGSASAAPPWASLISFKRIEADADNPYELDETHGPWMIMAASFAGESADKQAHDLVLELRKKFGLEAYVFQQSFDFTQAEVGLGWNKYGGRKMMKPMHATKFTEIAVLVGHFPSVEDPGLEKTLDKIKYAKPQVLDRKENNSTQRMAVLRSLYRFIDPDEAERTKGPMGSAFVTRNPLIDEAFFTAKGLEPFVVDMNRDLKYSLLTNPAKYTVRVASFRGVDTLKPAEFERLTSKQDEMAKIDKAAMKASRLCEALREQGVEAYEFHDRTESIVTIGSFDTVGSERPDGKTEINPAVHQIMKAYGPVETRVPGAEGLVLAPRMLVGIAFDTQPLPVEVPRESIGAAYNPTRSLFR